MVKADVQEYIVDTVVDTNFQLVGLLRNQSMEEITEEEEEEEVPMEMNSPHLPTTSPTTRPSFTS